MRLRAPLLLLVLGVAAGAAACGRASEDQINQALGITPTPTLSAAAIATGTAVASATAAARATAAAGTGTGTGGAAALGNVTRGQSQFQTYCMACHGPGGTGPNLLAPGGPGVDVTVEILLPLVHEGTGHPDPPGPYPSTFISDNAVRDIAAYIRSQAAP